jgi:thioester reductase-like protein
MSTQSRYHSASPDRQLMLAGSNLPNSQKLDIMPATGLGNAEHPRMPPASPPARGARTITELITLRIKQYPDEPIFGYPTDNLDYIEYTYSELDEISARVATEYAISLPVRTSSDQEAKVIALLGPSNLDYFFALLALSRLGFTVLFLSTRISEVAYLSLLTGTQCNHIVVDKSFQKMAKTLKSVKPDLEIIDIVGMTTTENNDPMTPASLDLDIESSKVAWIIHSSGSTGLPKPIYQTHRAALKNYEGSLELRGFVTLPLFHAFGLSNVFRGITAVKKIYIYNASLPLTSKSLLKILTDHDFDIFLAVPYALKLLSETDEGIAALAKLKVVMFGGSACPDALGDLLTKRGVRIISHYGTTETGQLMTSFRPETDNAWNYVREHNRLRPFLRMEPKGGNLFELCVLEGWPSKVATNRDDGSYATKDLFEPHPSIKGAWKYAGRLDDTIVLVNGEKAIPVVMEQALRQHKLVREAVIFGTGQSQLGLIIITSELAGSTPASGIIEGVWPMIEVENAKMPAYAQLTRDMVRILPSDTAFPSTDKGSLMRQAFYRAFAKEIEEVYSTSESNSTGGLILSNQELRDFLRRELLQIYRLDDSDVLSDDTDLFSLGVDSLQSTRLRGRILKEVQLNGHKLSQNVVFENPTIARLAEAIIGVRDNRAAETRDVIGEMQRLVKKYSKFPKHTPLQSSSQTKCVVVTGATGSLGAHIVAQLAQRGDIDEVCCLVRAKSSVAARERVAKSLRDRGVLDDLSPESRQKIVCHASDFSRSDLGLDANLLKVISDKITVLIHCAWSVNFNKSLSSFELDCIAGARHLMLLCLSAVRPTPASFNFCSSVSTVVSTPGDSVLEALPESFECAQGMGYAQSKLVTEDLVMHAAAQTGMQARVLRVGQVVADTKHGIWNDTEAIPLMLRSATTIGALPALDESPRWLPVDIVAKAVVEISLCGTAPSVFNVVNPRTFHWTKDLIPALQRAGLKFAQASQREWIQRLRESDPDPKINPTIKLLDFFSAKYDNDEVVRKKLEYVTTNAEKLAPVLSEIPALPEGLVQKFVRHFLDTSWAPASSG